MPHKIAFALRRRHQCEHVRDVLRANALAYPVYELSADAQYNAQLLKRIVKEEVQLLIATDVYAGFLMEQTDLQVVILRRGKIPFSDTIRQALRIADRVALVWRAGEGSAAQKVCEKFGPNVTFFPYQASQTNFEPIFSEIQAMGIRVVVGATSINEFADRFGMTAFNLPYDEEDILGAVRLAEHNLRTMEEELRFTQMLKSIEDSIDEGILTLDPDGKISMANRAAAQIMGSSVEQLVGAALDRTPLACAETDRLLQAYEPFQDKLLMVDGVSVAVSGKPITVNHTFRSAMLIVTAVEQLQRKEQFVRAQITARNTAASTSFKDIVGKSPAITEAIRTARRYARVDSAVLIYGQSGTGKEMFVQSIHNASARRDGPFVVINCAALPESLIESELFGYEKGSFTGALRNGKQGLFERGHKGTVFLDEISEMPLHVQARFLRVLQEKEVTPIGGNRVIPVDIRIVAATNRDLEEMVAKKEFREDLYYRIGVLTMALPPLNDRGNDIELLARHFVTLKNRELGLNVKGISKSSLDYLQSLSYPGNIRQLSNIVERAVVLCPGPTLELDTVVLAASHSTAKTEQPSAGTEGLAVDSLREEMIRHTLEKNGGNRANTARELGISVSTLYRRMKSFGMIS